MKRSLKKEWKEKREYIVFWTIISTMMLIVLVITMVTIKENEQKSNYIKYLEFKIQQENQRVKDFQEVFCKDKLEISKCLKQENNWQEYNINIQNCKNELESTHKIIDLLERNIDCNLQTR